MLNHKKSCIITALLCIIMAFAASPVFADGGNGTGSGDGSGNGENKDIPLTLESASITDGAQNVALNETI